MSQKKIQFASYSEMRPYTLFAIYKFVTICVDSRILAFSK